MKLRLQVNESESAVAPAWDRSFLGFSFWLDRKGSVRRRIAGKKIAALKDRIRRMTGRCIGRNLESVVQQLRSVLVGWMNYYALADLRSDLSGLDPWVRRRLRAIQLKQWKHGWTVCRELLARGISLLVARAAAAHCHRHWKTASHWALHTAFPTSYFDTLGLPRLMP